MQQLVCGVRRAGRTVAASQRGVLGPLHCCGETTSDSDRVDMAWNDPDFDDRIG